MEQRTPALPNDAICGTSGLKICTIAKPCGNQEVQSLLMGRCPIILNPQFIGSGRFLNLVQPICTKKGENGQSVAEPNSPDRALCLLTEFLATD